MTAVTVANISFPFIEEYRQVKFLPHEALSLTAVLEAAGYEVAFRDKNGVHVTPGPPALTAPDELPLPAYHQVHLNSYWEINLFSARGCPFSCTFCVRSGKLVEKSIDAIVRKISTLRHQYGQKRFFFYDQTFTLKKNRVMDLCRRLRAEGLNEMEWSFIPDKLRVVRELGLETHFPDV